MSRTKRRDKYADFAVAVDGLVYVMARVLVKVLVKLEMPKEAQMVREARAAVSDANR